MAKRLCDILMSLVAILLLAIPMAVIVLVIRLGSKGPAIFAQRRAGRDGKPFTMLKFRTMTADTDPYGDSPHSPRATAMAYQRTFPDWVTLRSPWSAALPSAMPR